MLCRSQTERGSVSRSALENPEIADYFYARQRRTRCGSQTRAPLASEYCKPIE
jgi:hypothetical protein